MATPTDQKLLALLAAIEFDKRYFHFYETHKSAWGKDLPGHGRALFESVLQTSGLTFVYRAKENFFHHEERQRALMLTLNVSFSPFAADFILAIKTPTAVVGGPYAALAYNIGRWRDASFQYSPRAPRLPFSTMVELNEAISLGVTLFTETKSKLLTTEDFG